MKPNVYIYILVMAGVTYLIRMLPLALAKKIALRTRIGHGQSQDCS